MNGTLSEAERRGILDGLESSDEEVRRLSVEQLLLLPIEEACEHLGRCLGDSGWRVRKSAVERLVACRHDPGVQEMLVESLADGENPGRRNAAFEALVACGNRVTPRLVGELDSPDIDVRKLVIDALAAIGDPDSLASLREGVADPDPNVRAAAAEALGVVGGAPEIAHLLEIVRQPEENVLVRLSSLRSLARMQASIGVDSLGDTLGQSLLRPAAYELLGHSSDPHAIGELIKGLASSSRSSREGAMGALLRTLGRLDDEAAESLKSLLCTAAEANAELVETACERLEVADLGSCMVLIQFLGLLGDPRVIVPILRSGRDEAVEELADATLESLSDCLPSTLESAWDGLDFDLQTRACSILGRIGGEVAERILVEALDSSDLQLRSVAAVSLGQGGFFDRLPDLVRRLELAARDEDADAEEEVATVVRAIVELAEHPDAAATGVDVQLIEVLSSRLAGAAEPVRLAIANVLARLGREQDVDVIGYLLKDESAAVRRAAVQALARFDFEQARDSLRLALGDEASGVRIAAASVLGCSECLDAAEDLARQMTDEDPRVVSVAVRAIGRLYKEHADAFGDADPLIARALEGEALVALAGLEALMEIGGEAAGQRATAVLRRSEPDVVRAGVACLGAHADANSIAEILPLVAHPDWSVRAEVVQVVSNRAYRKGLPSLLRRLEVEDDAFVREAILRTVERLEE